MFGCHTGKLFQVTVAGGSYQEGLAAIIQGVPPGLEISEAELYGDLLLRKPGADELSSPRKEPDLPVIYSGLNVDDTVPGANNKNHTNGTPLTVLIPNLDRHDIHVRQYQETNRTPRPGHASYASFQKYGPCDDAIGAGIFSGRYTAPIVAAGSVAKKILLKAGIEVFGFVKEAAGVRCNDISIDMARKNVAAYKSMRCALDPFYQEVYVSRQIHMGMSLLQKMSVLADIEKRIDLIREKADSYDPVAIAKTYGVHPIVNCPDLGTAQEMLAACNKITQTGDSSGGLIEVIATGLPVGIGEPVFDKLDAELGRMLGIGAVKGVEIGAGFAVKDMTGSQNNDQLFSRNSEVIFSSNNAGGVTGGLSTGQPVVVRIAVKPTPTIDKKQNTIDKYTLQNMPLAAITRRDPTIVGRIWPVAESMTAIILLDALIMHWGYQNMRKIVEA